MPCFPQQCWHRWQYKSLVISAYDDIAVIAVTMADYFKSQRQLMMCWYLQRIQQ